jgi:hypothetical protein
MSATYSKSSPYYSTGNWGQFLDVWGYNNLKISEDVTDALYQIDAAYNLRPDLLAYDMYQDSDLWWIFAVRNPDVLIDPLLNFTEGTIIYVPTLAVIRQAIGY